MCGLDAVMLRQSSAKCNSTSIVLYNVVRYVQYAREDKCQSVVSWISVLALGITRQITVITHTYIPGRMCLALKILTLAKHSKRSQIIVSGVSTTKTRWTREERNPRAAWPKWETPRTCPELPATGVKIGNLSTPSLPPPRSVDWKIGTEDATGSSDIR